MDGNATAEASITRPWQPDSPKTRAPCGIRRTSANGTSSETICCFVLLSAPRLADLILSLPPSAFRNCDSPQLASGHRQNRSKYQFAIDRYEVLVPSQFLKHTRRGSEAGEKRLPLFPNYIFCQYHEGILDRMVDSPGVIRIVSFAGQAASLDEEEVKSIRIICQCGVCATPHEFMMMGERVRIIEGPLKGVEGVFEAARTASRVIVNVTIISRSLSVEVDNKWLSTVPCKSLCENLLLTSSV